LPIFGKNSTNFVAKAVNHGRLTKIIYLLHPQNARCKMQESQRYLVHYAYNLKSPNVCGGAESEPQRCPALQPNPKVTVA